MITVEDIMVTSVYTLDPTSTLDEARRLMKEKDVRHIPVMDENQLVGVVTHNDVLATAESSVNASDLDKEKLETYIEVKYFMRPTPTTVEPGTPIRDAGVIMLENKFGCLPVIEGGILVGILTDSDFVGLAIKLIEQIEELEGGDDDIIEE